MGIREKLWERQAFNGLVEGDYPRAEKYFLKISRSRPGSPGTDYNLGLVRLAAGDFEGAEVYLLRDLERYGDSLRRFLTLGELYYLWGRPDQASRRYGQALEEAEKPEVLRLLRERMEKCASPVACEGALKARDRFQEGIALQKNRDYPAARDAFREAVELDGTHYQAWNNLGCLYLDHLDDPEQAEACFTRAASYSDLPAIGMNLARIRNLRKKQGGTR